MKKQWKRLLIAALTSSSVFAATWYWYQSSVTHFSQNGNEKPLAYVGTVVDDIQRRPASRLLWQLVNTGEPLYDGEAIRTSERGEVRIQFTDSDRYLDLEPESLIVIKKSAGEISLDLMEGSLFVNAKTGDSTDAPGLVLNSANGKVDLSKASASLTKGTGGSVAIDIVEGQASVQGSDGQTQDLRSQENIKIISPPSQKPLAMNAESVQPVLFQWQGFPANTKVSLWAGPSRKKLQALKSNENGAESLKVPLNFGRHYWKLVGVTAEGRTMESRIYRTEILARYAPTVVFPTSEAHLIVDKVPASIEFRWQKGDDTRQATLEVWADASLQKKISSKTFTTEESFLLPNLQPGTYFWRMSALYNDSPAPLLGKVQKFTVSTEPPVETPLAVVPVKVDVSALPTQYYVGEPQFDINWTADKTDQVASWRIKLLEENAPAETAQSFQSATTQFSTALKKPGRYIASVEALNKAGVVLGSTSSPAIEVLPRPVLGAPSFLPREGSLRAENNGRTQLQWTALEGAQEYWLTISKDGKELKKSKYRGPATSLKNLLPGEYDVEISATDAYGRPGQKSAPRKLIVPDNSGLKAPTLKKIQVN